MRARLALRLSSIDVEIQEIELSNRPPELYAVSSKGTVPVLVLSDGVVIDESMEIVKWAMSVDEHALQLVGECDGEFKHNLDRYKYATRYEDVDSNKHRAAGSVFLLRLNELLSKQQYLSGDEFGAADICIAPFVRQFRIADITWFDEQSWLFLNRWLQGYLESDDFKAIMIKVKP
jgi:glutathione S-transferase